MKKILLTDIYGYTNVIEDFAKELGNETLIIDPYQGENMAFDNQEAAYQYFSNHIGQDTYLSWVKSEIAKVTEPIHLIGFSIGATVAWRLSEIDDFNFKQVVCFYGSQIRAFIDVQPKCPTQLIFAQTEPGFSVTKLIDTLNGRQNISIEHTPYQHGFMSKLSANYHRDAYLAYLDVLQKY